MTKVEEINLRAVGVGNPLELWTAVMGLVLKVGCAFRLTSCCYSFFPPVSSPAPFPQLCLPPIGLNSFRMFWCFTPYISDHVPDI